VTGKNKDTYSSEKKFLTAKDVSDLLGVSLSTAYRIIKRLNDDLARVGKITVPGKVSSRYFFENVYI